MTINYPPVVDGYPPHKGPVTRKMFQFDDVIMTKAVGIDPVYIVYAWLFCGLMNIYTFHIISSMDTLQYSPKTKT